MSSQNFLGVIVVLNSATLRCAYAVKVVFHVPWHLLVGGRDQGVPSWLRFYIRSDLYFLLNDLGAFATPLMYCFRERERILDLFEMMCGARITPSYMRIGGVFQDAPEDFWPALNTFLKDMPHYVDELDQLITENEIVLKDVPG